MNDLFSQFHGLKDLHHNVSLYSTSNAKQKNKQTGHVLKHFAVILENGYFRQSLQ